MSETGEKNDEVNCCENDIYFAGKSDRGIPERDLTLAEIYGTLAILILKPTSNRLVEVVVYLLNGPGFAPKKSHVLRLGHSGRFAMNIVDDLVVVHHQVSSMRKCARIGLKSYMIRRQVEHRCYSTFH